MEKITYPDDVTLFLDECRGIYIPCDFAKSINREYIINREKWESDLDFLAKSETEKDGYWDIWQDVLDQLKVKIGRRTYFFYQHGPVQKFYQDGPIRMMYGPIWMVRNNLKVRKRFFKNFLSRLASSDDVWATY